MTAARLRGVLRGGGRLRTLGVDDGPFRRGRQRDVLVVGAVYAGYEFEGLLSTRVRQDGWNATDRLLAMIAGSKFHAQLHLVLLDGITLGGFNVVDLPRLASELELPCLTVTRRAPDRAAIARALERVTGSARRAALCERAGAIHRAGVLCFQVAGLEPELAREALEASTLHGHVPECLRAAHLIAAGIVTGESGRRA